jgi:ATP-binding cassette subfamily F protein uup
MGFKEKFEFEQLGPQIAALEQRKGELETLLQSESDVDAIVRHSAELGKVMEELDEKEMRWLELSEMSA